MAISESPELAFPELQNLPTCADQIVPLAGFKGISVSATACLESTWEEAGFSEVVREAQKDLMPIYEYECPDCGFVFEMIVDRRGKSPPCPHCGSAETKKLIAAPSVHIGEDRATGRIAKRVKDYLKDGKVSDATRFADKAASMVKSDTVKRIADKMHQKTGR